MFQDISLSLKNNTTEKITFRIDDIGASSKYFNQYSQFPFANFWFLKRMRPFKKWGKYEELTKKEWLEFLEIFSQYKIVPVVAITACWVEKDSNLVPFPSKFPEEAAVLKKAFLDNKIIVANHGLTHCLQGKHRPKLFRSNRKYHREFYPFLDAKVHQEHVLKSQEILQNLFEKPIEIFVPPGNIWSYKTYQALKMTNIKKVIANRYMQDSREKMTGIEFVDDKSGFFVFHDRDLKLYGKKWLMKKINEFLTK